MMAYEDTEDYKNLMKAQARESANAAEPGTESTAAFMKRTGTKATGQKQRLAVLRSSLKSK
jgi:hypothetical protein